MARYVVAVSGGVDSVVLLDMMVQVGDNDIVVAHVDHGIRADSAADERFVAALAHRYGLIYESCRYELGPKASEEAARKVRYRFLRQVAKKYDARIVTAHHRDDVIATMAINISRGTGWRGLATHGSDVARPLLALSKEQLYRYALHHQLEWSEDSTNRDHRYLRNRLRAGVLDLSESNVAQLAQLRLRQIEIKAAIDRELSDYQSGPGEYRRHSFIMMPQPVAIEVIRHLTQAKLTRPQMERLLLAIKTARPGSQLELGGQIRISISTRNFSLSLLK
ncbi:tRNA lysidine(34) synthetase TilS [Candidatus Saccharibacteria bacterium 32-49-12]|nr:MAG: tRNA lysidine(34) synthetase TilS [Candidatus Saccharibacteria bacterium 32-49-12]